MLKPELVGDQRDKFRVCGLAFTGVDGVAEKRVKRVEIAAVQGDFDCVTDGTFHSGSGGVKALATVGYRSFVTPLEQIGVVDRRQIARADSDSP